MVQLGIAVYEGVACLARIHANLSFALPAPCMVRALDAGAHHLAIFALTNLSDQQQYSHLLVQGQPRAGHKQLDRRARRPASRQGYGGTEPARKVGQACGQKLRGARRCARRGVHPLTTLQKPCCRNPTL